MSGLVFIDTNVPAYARDDREPLKGARAREWLDALWRARTGRTSYQVLIEYYRVVTHKFRPGIPVAEAQADVRQLLLWDPVAPSAALLDEAWVVHDRFGLQWYDTLIVAAAHIAGARYLLSEDFQHGQRFGELSVVNPFLALPSDLD